MRKRFVHLTKSLSCTSVSMFIFLSTMIALFEESYTQNEQQTVKDYDNGKIKLF